MGAKGDAHREKWRRRAHHYINHHGPMTLPTLLQTRKMVNCPHGDRWIRDRLDELESQGLIWWDPATSLYHSRAIT